MHQALLERVEVLREHVETFGVSDIPELVEGVVSEDGDIDLDTHLRGTDLQIVGNACHYILGVADGADSTVRELLDEYDLVN
jgi:hypothetical protein